MRSLALRANGKNQRKHLLALGLCVLGAAGLRAAEPEAGGVKAPAPAAPAAHAEPKPAAAPVPLLGNMKPAAVVFVDGKKLEKTWADEKPGGFWVIYEGTRHWHLRESIALLTWLPGEPDDELKKILQQAELALRAELERMKHADEERAKEEAAEAAQTPAPLITPGAGATAATASATAAAADGKGAKGAGDAARGTAKGSSGGDYTAQQAGGGASSAGDGKDIGDSRVTERGDLVNANRVFEWRVLSVNRKQGTVQLRNRGTHIVTTLKVKDPGDLKHIHGNDILTGQLAKDAPALNAADGTSVEFVVSEAPAAPTPPKQP